MGKKTIIGDLQVEKLSLIYRDTEHGYLAPQTTYGGLQLSEKTFVPRVIPTYSINSTVGQVSSYTTQLLDGGVALNTGYSDTNSDGIIKLKFPTDIIGDQTFATREWVAAQGYGSGSSSGGSVDTSNLVDLTSEQEITGTKNFSRIGINHPYGGLYGEFFGTNSANSGVELNNVFLAKGFTPTDDVSSVSNSSYGKTMYLNNGVSFYSSGKHTFQKLLFPQNLVGDSSFAVKTKITIAKLQEMIGNYQDTIGTIIQFVYKGSVDGINDICNNIGLVQIGITSYVSKHVSGSISVGSSSISGVDYILYVDVNDAYMQADVWGLTSGVASRNIMDYADIDDTNFDIYVIN